ncbi:hypothetical protein R1flu_009903 [Riccia fluitans]|uniref:Secreted protein n=1 Tax=Riccia fluitans TaxID=41844 RepID=A0ABD1Z3U4_9MARC
MWAIRSSSSVMVWPSLSIRELRLSFDCFVFREAKKNRVQALVFCLLGDCSCSGSFGTKALMASFVTVFQTSLSCLNAQLSCKIHFVRILNCVHRRGWPMMRLEIAAGNLRIVELTVWLRLQVLLLFILAPLPQCFASSHICLACGNPRTNALLSQQLANIMGTFHPRPDI